MKKLVTSLLLVVLLFNFIFSQCGVYASDPDVGVQNSTYFQQVQPSNTIFPEIIEEGTVSRTQDSNNKTKLTLGSFGISTLGMLSGILARIVNIFIVQIDFIMGVLTVTEESGDSSFWYTIERTVFNRIALFNINYFDTNDTYSVGDIEITANQSNLEIKRGIVNVYYICRVIALTLSLVVLIYIGIRMAISTVSSDQAKYKKMFVSWLESVVIIFITVYIMVAIMSFGELITGIFYDIEQQLINENVGYGVFEDTIRKQTLDLIFDLSGLELTIWSIIYWILLFMEIKFFWLYMKRLLMVGLLIIISPLITITYSIDKVGDGKAQVFATWTKEFIVNVLIQPLHALIYLIFVLTANAIALESPLVAVALLMSMGTVERMVKVVFDMRGLSTLRGVNKFLKKEG